MLTLNETCARLNCTPRQLRYRIKRGEIPARKVDGRWQIDEADLPRNAAADLRELARAAALKQEVGFRVSLRPDPLPGPRRRERVGDLRSGSAPACPHW